MKINDILEYLTKLNIAYSFSGDKESIVESYCPLKLLKDNSISWARVLTKESVDELNRRKNIFIFIPECNEKELLNCCYVVVDNPHKAFFEVMEHFFYEPPVVKIPKMSVIETDKIGKNVSIGEFCFIGPDVVIGDNCCIGNNVTIENKVVIGNNVVIDSGARIGTSGFGHFLNDDGSSTMIHHLGGVTIGNYVFIGANSIVARGTLSDTIIKDYVMIDILCGVSHNAEVWERTIITGGAGVAGSAIVKQDSWLGPGCIINAGTTVGNNCFIGMNSVVSHDIPDGKYAFGIPAKVIRDNADSKYKI